MGNGTVAKNPMPPSLWSYNKGVKDYDYNPEKAKQLLKDAGFPNGIEADLWTMPVERPYMPNGKKLGELMQADLAKVGIKVKLVTYDWPVYLEKSKNGEHTMLQMGWNGDNGDPDNFLNVLLSCSAVQAGGNRARWCNKEFDDLVQKARTTTKVAERTKLYMKAQEVFKREAPWVTVAHSVVFKAMSKNVQGYKLDPFGGDYFDQVDLTK
jgi:dipeptide transport system substrate-binding protein